MKKIFPFLMILLMVSFVTAELNIDVPTNVQTQNNFDVYITGASSLYAIELQIPTGFIIAADPANGAIGSDGIYRATYGSNLKLTLRAPKWDNVVAGNFYIKGKYTEGNGVKTFPDKAIEVRNGQDVQLSCPVCPTNSPWSICIDGSQTQSTYSCGTETNYICLRKVQTKSCTPEVTCKSGWTCIDNNQLGLQKTDCSYTSTVQCKNGCNFESNSCKPDTSGNFITGAVTGVTEGKGRLWLVQFFEWIVGIIKGLFGMN